MKLDDGESIISNLMKKTRFDLESHIFEFNNIKKFMMYDISQYYDDQTAQFSKIYDNLNSIEKDFQQNTAQFRKKINFSGFSNNEEFLKTITCLIKESKDKLSIITDHEKSLLFKILDISNSVYNKLKILNLDLNDFKKLFSLSRDKINEIDIKQSIKVENPILKNDLISNKEINANIDIDKITKPQNGENQLSIKNNILISKPEEAKRQNQILNKKRNKDGENLEKMEKKI